MVLHDKREGAAGHRGWYSRLSRVWRHEDVTAEAAKLATRDAYARHLKLCADLEAAHPAQ